MIKAMAAPYTGIKFMPTGGINAKNLEDYLSFDKIVCCGGSWMVKGELTHIHRQGQESFMISCPFIIFRVFSNILLQIHEERNSFTVLKKYFLRIEVLFLMSF